MQDANKDIRLYAFSALLKKLTSPEKIFDFLIEQKNKICYYDVTCLAINVLGDQATLPIRIMNYIIEESLKHERFIIWANNALKKTIPHPYAPTIRTLIYESEGVICCIIRALIAQSKKHLESIKHLFNLLQRIEKIISYKKYYELKKTCIPFIVNLMSVMGNKISDEILEIFISKILNKKSPVYMDCDNKLIIVGNKKTAIKFNDSKDLEQFVINLKRVFTGSAINNNTKNAIDVTISSNKKDNNDDGGDVDDRKIPIATRLAGIYKEDNLTILRNELLIAINNLRLETKMISSAQESVGADNPAPEKALDISVKLINF